MSRALVIINTEADRRRVVDLAMRVPAGTRAEFKSSKRTPAQNDRLWSLLTDVARQMTWHGQRLTADEWKLIFMDGLNREVRAVPSLDGRGVVALGKSSSDLSRAEMSDLQELIAAFGAQHGIRFKAIHDDEAA